MNPSLLRLLVVVCLSLVSGAALANPVATIIRLSAEVTGSTHVRLRFLSNVSSNPNLATYGTSHSAWFTNGDTTSLDAGSGARTMTYQYMCDCHVPTGSALTYQVTGSISAGFSPSYPAQLTATVTPAPVATTLCDEPCALADSRDAGVDSRPDTLLSLDVNVSRDPALDGGQDVALADDAPALLTDVGLPDSAATIPTGGAGAGGSVASGGASGSSSPATSESTSGGDDTAKSESKGGACSLSSHGDAGALSLFLAFGLMALSWRRRR